MPGPFLLGVNPALSLLPDALCYSMKNGKESHMLPGVLYYKTISSPIGPLRLVASGKGLCAILFHGGRGSRITHDGGLKQDNDHPVLLQAEEQLHEYFRGRRKDFDLALDVRGTVFQMKAWRELNRIPYGKTISYGEQAKRMGDARKARAVGHANGRNPLPIVVPCHRVIGASGALTGFGGGLAIKRYLLELEAA